MEIARNTLEITGYLITLFSLIPLIRMDNWYFRVFEYPRLQKLALSLLVTGCYISLIPVDNNEAYIFLTVSGLTILYLFYQVWPFTPFRKVQLIRAAKVDTDNRIRLFIANVYQYNMEYAKCLGILKLCKPDVILLVETDKLWADQLIILEKEYKYSVKVPLENTYGMMLYSRFKLSNHEVKYLVEDGVPSIHTSVRLQSGKAIKLHCLHPSPPVPQENPRSTERDKELILVAKEVKKSKEPVIVAGDLNDVAWSYTTELFSKVSGLLDPRKGRGFFNTFHARYFFMRFPLDHIFCSTDFTLVNIRRMNHIGSDHFPMFIELQYEAKAKNKQSEPQADPEEKEVANKKVKAHTFASEADHKK